MSQATNSTNAPKQRKPRKPHKQRKPTTHAERFQRKLDIIANVLTVDVQEAAAQLPKHAPLHAFATQALALAKAWNGGLRDAPELATLKGRMRSAAGATVGAKFSLSGNALRRAKILFKSRPEIATGPWTLDRVDPDAPQYYVLRSAIDPDVEDVVPIRNAARVKG